MLFVEEYYRKLEHISIRIMMLLLRLIISNNGIRKKTEVGRQLKIKIIIQFNLNYLYVSSHMPTFIVLSCCTHLCGFQSLT